MVGDVFVETADVAVGLQIHLERLQLDAKIARDVGEGQFAEVGLTGFRAEAGELRTDRFDLVVAIGKLIGERFERVAKAVVCHFKQRFYSG